MCRPEEELGFAPTSTTTANNSNNNAPPSSRSRSTNSFSGYASDLWSASARLYIFASGRLPSHSDSPIELFPMIYDAHVPYYTTKYEKDNGDEPPDDVFNDNVGALTTTKTKGSKNSRRSSSSKRKDPQQQRTTTVPMFSKEFKDLLSKVLERDPDKRAGIGDCLKHSFCKNARKQRITNYGEELKISSKSKKLVVRKEDVRNAFSISQVTK